MTSDGSLLVSSLGNSDYAEITFELDGRTYRTDLSPDAIVELAEEEIDAALILRTPEAGRVNDHRLDTAFSEANLDYQFVDIDLIADEADIDAVLRTVVDSIRTGPFDHESIILDISHSFRTLPLVFLIALMHLQALEEVTLSRIYYSRHAGSRDHDLAPILDLTYLHTLLRWYDAFADAKRTGTLKGVSTLLTERRNDLFQDGGDFPEFSDAVGVFESAQQDLDRGFPLEAGIKGRDALKSFHRLDESEFIGPEGTVLQPLKLLLDGFDTTQEASHKTNLELDKAELRRQARIVEFYRDHGNYRLAIECGRELLVNRLLYDAGRTTSWLEKETRKDIAPSAGNHPGKSSHPVDRVQQLWDQLSQARNMYAHAGHKTDNRVSDDWVNRCLKQLCRRIDDGEFWQEGSE